MNKNSIEGSDLSAVKAIKAEMEKPEDSIEVGMLTIKTANRVIEEAKNKPDPIDLFYGLIHEGEVGCLFSDSNLGKSILAVQIGATIAWKMRVLYLDCELTDKQFQLRYTEKETGKTHIFPDNFLRAEINPENMDTENYEDAIIKDIERAAQRKKVKMVIVDNLTYLCNSSEKGDVAGAFMKKLVNLKKKYNLTLLIIAHTPKRDASQPICKNDLAGSRKLFNFFDTIFAIGESAQDGSMRYVKQIKVRAGEFLYDADNVIVYEIAQIDGYLKFLYRGFSYESQHLKKYDDSDTSQVVKNVLELKSQGKSIRIIAEELGLSKSKVGRIVKENKDVPNYPSVPTNGMSGTVGQRDKEAAEDESTLF